MDEKKKCAFPKCKNAVEAVCDACGECESCADHFENLYTCNACELTTCDNCMFDYKSCGGCKTDIGCIHCGSCMKSELDCRYQEQIRSASVHAILAKKYNK